MQVITPGYKYLLENFQKSGYQTIQFLERGSATPQTDSLQSLIVTINEGTTNEEMLAVLIDRIAFLQNKFPCRENAIVLTKLEESLMWLNKRTEDRKARGVLG